MKCCRCGLELKLVLESQADTRPELACWDGGTVDVVIPGYGSIHDMSKLVICFCDNCISLMLETKEISQLEEPVDPFGDE